MYPRRGAIEALLLFGCCYSLFHPNLVALNSCIESSSYHLPT